MGALIGLAVGIIMLAMALRTLLIALFDATTRREVTGEIVRMRAFKHDKNKCATSSP